MSAIVRYVRSRGPAQVTLVRMGHEARERCAEDDLCASTLVTLFEGGAPPTTEQARDLLRDAPAARKFFDPACDWAPRDDFDYCTDVDRFDFVLRVRRTPGEPVELERVAAP
jgi:2-phosphosulfolactate phosphatase